MHARHLIYETETHVEASVEGGSGPLLSSDERRDVVVDILASTIPEIDLSDIPDASSDRRSWSLGPASPWKNRRERRRGLSYLREPSRAANPSDNNRTDRMGASKSFSSAFDALAAADSSTGPKLASPPVFYDNDRSGHMLEDDPFAAEEPSEHKPGTNSSPWKTSPWKTSPWKARRERQAELASPGFFSDDADGRPAELSRQASASISGVASLPPLIPKLDHTASLSAYTAFDQMDLQPADSGEQNTSAPRRQRQRNRVKYGFSPSRSASFSDLGHSGVRKPAHSDENV